MDALRLQRLWNISDFLAVESNAPDERHGIADDHDNQSPCMTAAEQGGEWIQRTELGHIEETILSHKSVKNAAVVWKRGDDIRDDEIVAFVALKSPNADHAESPENEEETQRVRFWDDYWNGCTYTAMNDLNPGAIGRDFLGWTSMYDGKEIDKVEMNEWLDETIATIRRVHGEPRNVFEVGAGSGMILFNLARDVRSYVGLEMSPTAIEFVKKAAISIPDLASKIHMIQGTAADLDFLTIPTSPDLVVINSVAQYFPSQDYLLEVIETISRYKDVETLFLGDIRSYALYDEFLFSKALHDAGGSAGPEELQTRIAVLKQRELELLIDPAFFTALPDAFPKCIEHVEIHPKRMKAANELSCFRYAAVIYFKHRGRVSQQLIRKIRPNEWIDFVGKGLDGTQLLRHLESSQGVVAVSNIPNSKTVFHTQVINSLREEAGNSFSPDQEWLETIRNDAKKRPSLTTLELLELGQRAGYRVELSSARQHLLRGGLDAIFHKYEPSEGQASVMFHFPTDYEGRNSKTFCTRPLELEANQAMREQLSEFLQLKLPVHLLPHEIKIMETLMINENGEVDRQGLARLV